MGGNTSFRISTEMDRNSGSSVGELERSRPGDGIQIPERLLPDPVLENRELDASVNGMDRGAEGAHEVAFPHML